MPPIIIAGVLAGAGALGGAAIASRGANSAANTQANAANSAAALQAQAEQQSLAETQREFGINQANLQPWLTQGRSALANLGYLMGTLPLSNSRTPTGTQLPDGSTSIPGNIGSLMGGGNGPPQLFGARDRQFTGDVPPPQFDGANGDFSSTVDPNSGQPIAQGNTNDQNNLSQYINPGIGSFGSLMKPFDEQFQAPDALTEQNDPGFQARMKLSTDAIERGAASRGGLLTGGTARDLDQFAQDYASNEYSNVYSRAFNNYSTKYNIFKQNQADQFNRLSSLAGGGQVAAGQLGTLGTNNANSIASILMNSSANIGQQLNNAGAARASGYVGSANAYGSAFGSLGNLGNLFMLQKMLNPSTSAASQTSGAPVFVTG